MVLGKGARIALVAAGLMVQGCAEVVAPGSPMISSGTYVLANVSGRGPATGVLILTRQGYAERRVRFTEPSGGLSREYIAIGSFEIDADGTIRFAFREMGTRSDFIWKPTARIVDDGVQLRHLDAADGPDVIEEYRLN